MLVLSVVLIGCSGQSNVSEMDTTVTDLETDIIDFSTAMSAHDVGKVLSLLAENIEVIVTDEKIFRGKEEYSAYLTDLFSRTPDFNVETISFFSSGDHVCEEWIINGTPSETLEGMVPVAGMSYTVRGASVSERREGKYIRIAHYYDNASLMEQLGILPQTPQE